MGGRGNADRPLTALRGMVVLPRVARVPEGTADCPEVFKVLKGILPQEQKLITCLRAKYISAAAMPGCQSSRKSRAVRTTAVESLSKEDNNIQNICSKIKILLNSCLVY